MPPLSCIETPDYAALDDESLVRLAKDGHRDAFREIMQRCNQRLFRVARALVRDDSEAEDIVQETYMRGFANLATFRGDAKILTWLTRIALNEARSRLRRRRPTVDLDQIEVAQGAGAHVIMFPNANAPASPETDAARSQIRRLLERAIDDLPEPFRVVFIMREIEDCSVQETADNLDLRPETVKTRLHRARRLLRSALDETLASTMTEAFPFLGQRCDRITNTILERLAPDYGWDDPA